MYEDMTMDVIMEEMMEEMPDGLDTSEGSLIYQPMFFAVITYILRSHLQSAFSNLLLSIQYRKSLLLIHLLYTHLRLI